MNNLTTLELYKEVLKQDSIKVFPRNYWRTENALENAKICTKYLIEEILKLNEEELKEQLCTKLFKGYRLGSMLQYVFDSSPYKAISAAYDGKFKAWEFKIVPNGFWHRDNNAVNATRWLIEEKLQLNDEQLKEQLSEKLFKDNGLMPMLYI